VRLTDQQRTALAFPCRLACETANPKFSSWKGGSSIVLTINNGYE